MKSRRTFLKVLAGMAGVIIPWTILPKRLGQGLEVLVQRPPVQIELQPKQYDQENIPLDVLRRKAIEDIQALSDPQMEGRRTGTMGETKSLVYIEEQIRSLELQPFGEDKYWQMFFTPSMEERVINGRALFRPNESEGLRLPAANFLAGLVGEDQDACIILCAHYDHLGIYQGRLCPGANDNASGVGCVLEVARRLVREAVQGSLPKINILIAFWSGEEMGYLGSKHFVKNPVIPLSKVKAVINMDTIANSELKEFILWSNENTELVKSVQNIGKLHNAKVEYVKKQGHQSDEAAFEGTGIPAVTLLSKQWLEKNHTPEDDLSIIHEAKLETACEILYDVVKKLAY